MSKLHRGKFDYEENASHIVQIVALLLERVSTVFLAILLLRLHRKMAQLGNVMFMKTWASRELKYTKLAISMLLVSLLLSVIDEALLWHEQRNKAEYRFLQENLNR